MKSKYDFFLLKIIKNKRTKFKKLLFNDLQQIVANQLMNYQSTH